jgi:hypothetical protein
MDSDQEYPVAKKEPPWYNHGRNQSRVTEMMIRPITEATYAHNHLAITGKL